MELDKAIQKKHHLIAAFYTDWNASSFIMSELLKQLQCHYADRFEVLFINADESGRQCTTYGIRKIPTLVFFQQGKIVKTVEGTASRADIVKLIETFFGTISGKADNNGSLTDSR